MARLDDFSKIIVGGHEIGKVLHQGKVIWQSGLDLSDPNLWELGRVGAEGTLYNNINSFRAIRLINLVGIESRLMKININTAYVCNISFYNSGNTWLINVEDVHNTILEVPTNATKFKLTIHYVKKNTDISTADAVTANANIEFL